MQEKSRVCGSRAMLPIKESRIKMADNATYREDRCNVDIRTRIDKFNAEDHNRWRSCCNKNERSRKHAERYEFPLSTDVCSDHTRPLTLKKIYEKSDDAENKKRYICCESEYRPGKVVSWNPHCKNCRPDINLICYRIESSADDRLLIEYARTKAVEKVGKTKNNAKNKCDVNVSE